MTKALTLQVDYGIDGEQKCSGVLFEIPTLDIIGGDVLDFRLWGMSYEMLAPYAIRQGLDTIGSGELRTMPVDPITEHINFGGSMSAPADWYITSVTSIIANGDILDDGGGIWATDGSDITGDFTWINDILTTFDNTLITGAVTMIYESSQDVQDIIDFYETNDYQAEWPIESIGNAIALTPLLEINAATGEVLEYAPEGADVTALFTRSGYSCIRVIDGTKLYGTIQCQYTRSPYYKLFQWTVPIGKQGQYWFFIYKNSLVTNKFSIELPDLTSGLPVPRNISIFVYARISETAITDAEVYIGGLLYGKTDFNGNLQIDGILTGTYPLKIIAPGYTPTDEDNLANDQITIY